MKTDDWSAGKHSGLEILSSVRNLTPAQSLEVDPDAHVREWLLRSNHNAADDSRIVRETISESQGSTETHPRA